MEVGVVQAKSDLLDDEVPPEPCHAHVVSYREDSPVVVPSDPHPGSASEDHQGEPAEVYQFDRALHAMVAGLTGGISPVALSLAYIDWAAHLAAAPQRQLAMAPERP